MIADLFGGPGGADEGARLAGYTGPIVGIEKDHDACLTAVKAGHWRIQADVATYPTAPFVGKVDGLWASPPCQTFSKAGRKAGLTDPRGELVWQPVRWARDLMPRWVALEQVEEVLPIWQIVAAQLREFGYSTWTGKLLAADYGVPQTRTRAVLVARLDEVARPPAPTHAALDVWVMTRPATTVLGDPRIGRPGHKNWDKGEAQFQNGSVPVSVEEAAVLQSFRADYPFQGSKSSRHQQVGNAVPPLLAAAILRPLLVPSEAQVAA